jgi:hypothetical protein
MDFKDIITDALGWSKVFTSANARGLATFITDCVAFNPDQDTAGILWHRILPFVPSFDLQRFKSSGRPHAGVFALPVSQVFDLEKFVQMMRKAGFCGMNLRMRLQFKQGSCMKLNLTYKDHVLGVSIFAPDAAERDPRFFKTVVKVMGLERFADFTDRAIAGDGTQKVHFRVLQRVAGAFEMVRLGANFKDNEGTLYALIDFNCHGQDASISFLKELAAREEIEWLKVDKVQLYNVPITSWDHAVGLLREYGTKECLLYVGCLGTDTCQITPPDLDVEMAKYDLITLGFLGGPGLPKSRDVPRFVRERLLSVDMVREDGGWSFCLTSLERELSRKYRNRLNEYLNTQLGFPFITRSPKELWGDLLKRERKTIL